jgi:hypothetical protein
MTQFLSIRALAVVLTTLAVSGLGAALQDTQTVDAGGLKFQAPKEWKSVPPKGGMRKAELSVPPASGDKDPGVVAVFAFPGGAGGVEANLERWQKQFRDASGNPPKLEPKNIKSKSGVPVTRVELAGTYTEPTFGQGEPTPKPNYRLLGAIVETPQMSYFLRLTGPENTVKGANAAFDKALDSIETGGK